MPLLDGERRKLEVLRKKSLLRERVINYQSLLFKVINDVQERLKKIELQIEKITLIKRQIEITEQTLKIATDNYTQGLGDWVKVTAVFNQLQGSRSSLLTAQRELLETKIDLLVALGGQWIDNLLTSSRYKSVEDLAK
jgi:outer membrane protein TolC